HVHQSLHQGEPDAEAALRLLERAVELGEHFEDRGKMVGWNADTVVLDRHDYIAAVARRPQSDVALARREFESVVEQVAKYLGEPDRIGMDVNRLGRQVDFEAMGGLFRERLADF